MHIIEWSQFCEEGLPPANDLSAAHSAITIGVFDGVHRGHQTLIERIVRYDRQSVPLVITFRNNHKIDGAGENCLLSFRQKASILESLGAAICVAADLTESFRRIPGAEFLRLLRERGRMGFLAVGSNFRCGYKLDIDAQNIKKINAEKGIPTDIVEAVGEGSLPVSSSRIRDAISKGKLGEASAMLGRSHCIDLTSSPLERDNHDLVYKRSALNCVLPPNGTYAVLLRTTKSGLEKQSELRIEEAFIRILNPTVENWDIIVFA